MQISKERLEEFKDMYYRHFGERISDQIAYERASRLVRLIEAVYKPIKQEK